MSLPGTRDMVFDGYFFRASGGTISSKHGPSADVVASHVPQSKLAVTLGSNSTSRSFLRCQLRCKGGDDSFEARVAAERIPHRIQNKIAVIGTVR